MITVDQNQGKQIRTLADVQTLIKALKTSQPEYFPISPESVIQIWRYEQMRRLYAAIIPNPRMRLLRKSKMRRIHARMKQGRRRIAQRERQAKKLQILLGDLANMAMPPRSVRMVTMQVTYKGRGEPLPFTGIEE